MKVLIVGMGEVGKAYYNILKDAFQVVPYDVVGDYQEPDYNSGFELMLVAIQHSDKFESTVREYCEAYRPALVNVLTTVPPGTCERLGNNFTHSTTRGLHPKIEEGLRLFTKHIGGPTAESVAEIYRMAGITCVIHGLAKTTELAHILNNYAYGVNLMLADEMQAICRHFGVDFVEAVIRYTMTNNEGYRAIDHDSKTRMVLTPPGGSIGGHYVTISAGLIARAMPDAPLLGLLAHYNEGLRK